MRKLVWVEWRDAAIDSHKYLSPGEAHDPLATIETAGFLVSEDEHALTLAMGWNSDVGEWRGIIGIPVGCITKKKVFRVDDKKADGRVRSRSHRRGVYGRG